MADGVFLDINVSQTSKSGPTKDHNSGYPAESSERTEDQGNRIQALGGKLRTKMPAETPYQLPHLPNEIWLTIISHCEKEDETWRNLRPLNRQLRACVEQHFAENVIPRLKTCLPVRLPSYDMRNPHQGEAVFRFYDEGGRLNANDEQVTFQLSGVGPHWNRAQFMDFWAGMKDIDGGKLRDDVKWWLKLDSTFVPTKVKDAWALDEGVSEGEARIRFEWKSTLTAFFRLLSMREMKAG